MAISYKDLSYQNAPKLIDTTKGAEAPQMLEGVSTPIPSSTPVTGFTQYDKPAGPTYTAPTVISSAQGEKVLEKKNETLAKLTSNPLNALPGETPEAYNARLATMNAGVGTGYGLQKESDKKTAAPTGTVESAITYINPATGQTQKISAESLTPEVVKNLTSQGFSIQETSGNLPSWALQNNPELGQAESELNKARSEFDSLKTDLNKFTVSDADLQEQIRGITSQWDARISDMNRINERRGKSIETLGTRLGSRYTGGKGGVFGGIISEEERQGVSRIAELEGMKQAAITEAKEAARTKNWEVYSKKVDLAEKAYKEKLDAVAELNKAVAENNKKIKEKEIQSSRDSAVSDLIMQGITSPTEILSMLNYDKDGNLVGDFTAKEISDTLNSLKTVEKEFPGIVGEWIAAKENDPSLANTSLEEYMQVKDPDRALKAREAQLRVQKLEQDLGGAGAINPNDGRISVNGATARTLNKEIVSSDPYKVIRKSQDSLQFLDEFQKVFDETGLETFPGKNKSKLSTTYQTTLLNLKEFFNLGVLNGPDLTVLKGIIPDPTSGVLKKFRGRKSGVEEGITQMKKMIEETLDDRYKSISSQYKDYSPDSVSALDDLDRIYVEQKAKLNPKVQTLLDENPDMSYQDLVQIIQ